MIPEPDEFGSIEARSALPLEHDPEKWTSVFRKDHAPPKNLDHDPIQLDWIMV
jgi:hypothetical protein